MTLNYLNFKKFLAASGLSTRRFGDLCGIGKTTVHRLAQPQHGGLTPKYVRGITPALLRACRDHLIERSASHDSIHLILTDIFEDAYTPSIVSRAALTPDMLRFFGLSRDPFAAPRKASEVFLTPEMERISAILSDAARYQGFACVLAPVGAGKTVIKNLICTASGSLAGAEAARFRTEGGSPSEQPPGRRRYEASRETIILNPSFPDISKVTAAGIVHYILESFHIRPRRSLLLAQKQLEDHLAELTTPVALCFDECHRLSDATLTALKNFYELGTGGFRRYLGLVLLGQPQFAVRLAWPRFREIAERLAVFELPPFSPEDTENFLMHCLRHARLCNPATPIADVGSRIADCPNPISEIRDPQLLAPEAIRAIASRASTPLAVANLAAAGMTGAYKKGERQVTARFIPGEC